jgi:sulfane dehydrogenase subunit SoxC
MRDAKKSRAQGVTGMSKHDDSKSLEPVAGKGLLHRRAFLRSATLGGTAAVGFMVPGQPAAQTAASPRWMKVPGRGMDAHGERSHFEGDVVKTLLMEPGTVGAGASFTPHQRLEGTITPSGLHFERHHNGIPEIDPAQHRLLIHGLVERPLFFDLEALSRYPLVSRIRFLECSGNGRMNIGPTPAQATAGELYGLLSCSDWTGVPLSILLHEAGLLPGARWVVAEGADSAAMVRSVPLEKILDDAIIAIYQNGERLRPGNGYPMRLFLPGWEGNASVKWLRRLKVTSEPVMARDETSKYTDLQPDGRARMFTFPMGVKSLITSPSGEQRMHGPGLYQISGIAWSGAGRIARVDVSADGGETWAEAALSEPVLSKSLTRFRIPWRWDGGPAVLQSRAVDETATAQPTRDALLGERGVQFYYHYNAVQSWAVTEDGEVGNVYA